MKHAQWPLLLASALFLAACQGEQKAPVPPSASAPAAASAPTAAVSAPIPAASAEAAKTASSIEPGSRFTAYGFSPVWQAEIRGNKLVYEVPETSGVDKSLRTIVVARLAHAKGVNYEGQDGKVHISVDISSGPCDLATDTGKPRDFFATLRYGKATYKGCADAVR